MEIKSNWPISSVKTHMLHACRGKIAFSPPTNSLYLLISTNERSSIVIPIEASCQPFNSFFDFPSCTYTNQPINLLSMSMDAAKIIICNLLSSIATHITTPTDLPSITHHRPICLILLSPLSLSPLFNSHSKYFHKSKLLCCCQM